jgi:nucleotide-binding universal stress UspA family protein
VIQSKEDRVFKTIALGLDGSEGSKKAIPIAAHLARNEDGRLFIIHVEEIVGGAPRGSGPLNLNEDQIQDEIRRVAAALTSEGIDVDMKVVEVVLGGPAQAIANAAHEERADLIVVGSRGHSAALGALVGSVAMRLPNLAKEPVLIVPEDATVPP